MPTPIASDYEFREVDPNDDESSNEAFDYLSYVSGPLFDAPFYASPASDMRIDSSSLYLSLPSLVDLKYSDHQALDYFQKEIIFGFGSKSPTWSTHAILLESGSPKPVVLHLLLAASLTELGCQHPSFGYMTQAAEKHYRIGRRLLRDVMRSGEEPDHLAVMAAFWFLYLHQRRRGPNRRPAYRELSDMMREHIQKYRLEHILASSETSLHASQSWELPFPKWRSLLSRLIIWLFWADAQSCFQGEGGSMARLLVRSSSSSSYASKGIFDMYDRSRGTLELYWGTRYPDSEVVDDLKNGAALELIHHTWVIVQEINEATEFGALDAAQSRELKSKMEDLRTRFPFSSVFRLSESAAMVRDRLMANADWAVCNYYALCIYQFRCGLDGMEAAGDAGLQSGEIEEIVASLLILVQKTLAGCEKGQLDRLQWSLFWAGIESADPYTLMNLTSPSLQAALEAVLLEQSGKGRIGISRIRQICREKSAGFAGSGFDGWTSSVA